MKRRLSSITVPIYKLLLVFFLGVAIYRLFQDFRNITKPGWIFLFAFCAAWYWRTHHWKSVYLNGNSLLVSNYLKTIKVPLSEIQTIEPSIFWGWQPQTIKLKLKSISIFGDEIVYVPRMAGLNAKPFADELRHLIESQ